MLDFDNLFFLSGHLEHLGKLTQGKQKQYLKFSLVTKVNNKPMPFFMIAFDKVAIELAKLNQDDTIMVNFTTREQNYVDPKTKKRRWETVLTVNNFTLLKTAMRKAQAVNDNHNQKLAAVPNQKGAVRSHSSILGDAPEKNEGTVSALSYEEQRQEAIKNVIMNDFLRQ